MYSVRVKQELGSRLDAEFYSPDALQAINRIHSVGEITTLGEEIVEGYRVVYHGTDSVANLPDSKKLGFLSPTQISNEGAINFDSVDELPLYYKDQYPKGLAKSGELLIEVKGNVSKVAVVPSEFPENLMISGSLYKATLSEKIDSHYAVAFLKSKQGQLLKNRLTSNTIINYIGKEDLYSIPVLLPAQGVQKYIGDKIRQAERLREWAKLLGRSPVIVEALLKGLITEQELIDAQRSLQDGCNKLDKAILSRLEPSDSADETDKCFLDLIEKCKWESVDNEREHSHVNRISASDIENFLTAQTYRPEITHAFEIATKMDHVCLQSLCIQPIRQGTTPKFSAHGKSCLKSKQTREIIIDDVGFETVDPSDPGNSSVVRLADGDVVITRQGAGTVGRASIFLGDAETYVTDSLFVVRVDKEKADPGYIAAFLRTYTGKRLIEKGVYGSTGQLNLAGGHVRNIPIMDMGLMAQNYVGDKVRLVNDLRSLEKSLTRASKNIVEALIEGRLTEQQLIDAQKALEADDTSLDRDILARLTTKGLDGNGDLLFADLDQLYDLLAQSQQMDE